MSDPQNCVVAFRRCGVWNHLVSVTIALLFGGFGADLHAQIGVSHVSLESACAKSDVVVKGRISDLQISHPESDPDADIVEVTVEVVERFKGEEKDSVSFRFRLEKFTIDRKEVLDGIRRFHSSQQHRIWLFEYRSKDCRNWSYRMFICERTTGRHPGC